MGWKDEAVVGGTLTRKPRPNPTRRDFLRPSFVAGGALLVGLDRMPTLAAQIQTDAFEGGKHLGNLDFAAKRLDSRYYVRCVEVTEI